MSNSPATCQPQRIELFLKQQLTDAELSAFESHLDGCEQCRSELELQTAKADVWEAVRDSLGSDDLRSSSATRSGGGGGGDGVEGDDAPDRADSVLRLLSPTDDPRMLGRIGGYEVAGVVGIGGMGVVLKGLDPALNRYVAIKALAPHLAASGSARQRFAREAQAAAAVTHENVVAIHSVSEWNGLPYLVMPYVRGESLQKRLDQHGPLGVQEILRVGRQTAAGLAAAHAQGLVHRDIKPGNILLEDGVERLKITDFGLARAIDDASLTRTGVIAGTPQYMSPEQARGDAIDARSDLFSLGSVLYALCAGRPPFRAETSYGILRRITDTEPRALREINPEIPDWLCRLISRLLSKSPDERFGSANEVAELFEQCLAHVQQPSANPLPEACRTAPAPMMARFSRRRIAVAGCIAVCVALVSPAVRPLLPGRTNRPPETAAETKEPPAPAASIGDPDVGWDGSAAQVEKLKQDGDEFESRVKRLWDPAPSEGADLDDANVDAESP